MPARHAFIRSAIAASLLLAVSARAGEYGHAPARSAVDPADETAYRTEFAPAAPEPASIGLLLAGLCVLAAAGRSRGRRS